MGRYIVKLSDQKQDYYLEWSTIVDAPVSFGMPLEEFKQYYQELYGTAGMAELDQRLQRVEKSGTSSLDGTTVDDLAGFNRAGEDETCLSLEQLVDAYCVKRLEDSPRGRNLDEQEL